MADGGRLRRFGAGLQERYDTLPKSHHGFERLVEGPHAGKRTGVFTIPEFYSRFIRYDHVPRGLAEWRSLPDSYLATATNGRVFADPLGEFTALREGLLAYYPGRRQTEEAGSTLRSGRADRAVQLRQKPRTGRVGRGILRCEPVLSRRRSPSSTCSTRGTSRSTSGCIMV